MTLNVFLPDVGKRDRPPARLVILVDDHCAHAFVKSCPWMMRDYAEFHAQHSRNPPAAVFAPAPT